MAEIVLVISGDQDLDTELKRRIQDGTIEVHTVNCLEDALDYYGQKNVSAILLMCEKTKHALDFGKGLIINPNNHNVTFDGKSMQLTKKEFDLLFCLASHAGQVLSKEQIYKMIWDEESAYNVDEVVKAHIKALRKKMGKDGAKYIQNVWGIGYRFSEEI